MLLGDFHLGHMDTSVDVCLGSSVEHLAENIFRFIRLCEILTFCMLFASFTIVDENTNNNMIVCLTLLSEELLKQEAE